MCDDNVNNIIKTAIIKTLKLKQEFVIDHETRLREDLGLDSMASLELLLNIEEKISGFSIEPGRLEPDDLKTYRTLCNFIKNEISYSEQFN